MADPGAVSLISGVQLQQARLTQEQCWDSGNGPSSGLSSDKHGD